MDENKFKKHKINGINLNSPSQTTTSLNVLNDSNTIVVSDSYNIFKYDKQNNKFINFNNNQFITPGIITDAKITEQNKIIVGLKAKNLNTIGG